MDNLLDNIALTEDILWYKLLYGLAFLSGFEVLWCLSWAPISKPIENPRCHRECRAMNDKKTIPAARLLLL